MSKFFSYPVVGIDVSADFSFVSILSPNGDTFKSPFKINHDLNGFNHLVNTIKKVEEEFSMKSAIFMESTGVYHLTLFHFLSDRFENTFVINPLITKSIKNFDIREVKNDKWDSLRVAKVGKFQNIKFSQDPNHDILMLKNLSREYYRLTDMASDLKKKLSCDLRVIFPGYCNIFSNLTSDTSMNILLKYPDPKSLLNASKEDVLNILSKARKGIVWSENIYSKLFNVAQEALIIGVDLKSLSVKIVSSITLINAFETQISNLLHEIDSLINSDDFSESIKNNIEFLDSIPGIAHFTAVSLIAEIGDIKGFIKPKHLVAFFGIDSSVKESGKFKGNKNKMSKRGTRFGRRALYAVALASIRNGRNGSPINYVLQDYYKSNLNGKKPKVALVAIMHKLLNYIFSVLKNQKSFEIRDPKIHKQMFLENIDTTTVA